MSSGVELLFNDSRAGTALYLSPVSLPITFDEWETSREGKSERVKTSPLVALKMSCAV